MVAPSLPPGSSRIKLNVGGRKFETTVATLTGQKQSFFSSLLCHTPEEHLQGELFIDRDGDAFVPILNFLRTGVLYVPPSLLEPAVRMVCAEHAACIPLSDGKLSACTVQFIVLVQEAEFYCINLPESENRSVQVGCVRCDGIYLSFGGLAAQREGGSDEESGSTDARAYLIFHEDGSASLGRREADAQWTALRCRYRCLPGCLLMVHRWEPGEGSSQDEDGDSEVSGDMGGAAHGMGPLELSAIVLAGDFIRVMACRRVGRLENPFHFFESAPPCPGSAFISQVAQPSARSAGRVVISFENDSQVGVLVTSSQPGWSSASATQYTVRRGHTSVGKSQQLPNGRVSPRLGSLGSPVAQQATSTMPDALCHVEIVGNGNFSRTVDLVRFDNFMWMSHDACKAHSAALNTQTSSACY